MTKKLPATPQILYIVVIKTWVDKTYGNSYSSARVTSTGTGRLVGKIEMENGSSRYCEQVTLAWLQKFIEPTLEHSRIEYIPLLNCLQRDVRNWGN